MAGFAVTDWYRSGGMNMVYGLLAGTDLPDGSDSIVVTYGPGTGHGYHTTAVRRAAQRIMYTVANSNAMNFFGEDTITYSYDPDWFAIRDGVIVAVSVVFVVSLALVCTTTLLVSVDKAKLRRKK